MRPKLDKINAEDYHNNTAVLLLLRKITQSQLPIQSFFLPQSYSLQVLLFSKK